MTGLKEIGENIRSFRKRRGFTQERLAERADISTIHLSHIETGAVTMSLDCLIKLCGALGATPNALLLGSYKACSDSVSDLLSEQVGDLSAEEIKLLVDFAKLIKKSRPDREA